MVPPTTLLCTTSLVTCRVTIPLVSVCCEVIIIPSVPHKAGIKYVGICRFMEVEHDVKEENCYLWSRGRWLLSVCWPLWAVGKPLSLRLETWTGCWTATEHLMGTNHFLSKCGRQDTSSSMETTNHHKATGTIRNCLSFLNTIRLYNGTF